MEFGKNCSKVDCNQLDFLPIRCSLCGLDFCKDHSEISSHGCQQIVSEENFISPLSYPCTIANCSDKTLTPIYCNTCGRLTCIKHKQKELHNCSSLIIKAKEDKINLNLISLKEQLSKVNNKPASSSVTRPLTVAQHKQKLKINLIKLKMKAKSPKNGFIPEENKCFFRMIDKQSNKELCLIANRKWSFNRIYEFTIENFQMHFPKIQAFSEGSQKFIPTDSNIDELLSQEIIFDGDNILFIV